MKRFDFKLQKVLSYKTQIVDLEKNKLAALNRAHSVLLNERITLNRQRSDNIRRLSVQQKTGIPVGSFAMHRNYIRELEKKIAGKDVQILKSRQDIDKQIAVVVESTKEEKTLQTLKDKRYEVYQYEERKAEEKYIEEFVSNKAATAVII